LWDRYSYVKYLTDAGYDSFTLDRIGTGKSDHPPSSRVTVPSNAFVVHEVVQALRVGSLGGKAYPRVIGVGRSLGAAVMYEVSVDYGDLDAIIVVQTTLLTLSVRCRLRICAKEPEYGEHASVIVR
jgi:pimeloyl-ACP methyl ester carboxylesterase